MTNPPTRRTVLGTGAAAALIVGCSKYGDNTSSTTTVSPAAADDDMLAKKSDIPVGGGKIFKDKKVVVTQPKKDEFKCFSAICTHEGCTVSTVSGGTINCPCHGSKFKIENAAVAHGPATRPLPAKKIIMDGNSIRLG
ncbi:Rieske (2Fe-2S) protein [Streptomyces sp. NPDC058476]|uniref:Rieske (2Fe-2S) protein n=1 Tax=Streptomyces sp. NPDC058476 TaxID=3346519 RepID=UPI00365EBC17